MIHRRSIQFFVLDVLIVTVSFLFLAYIKPATLSFYLPFYYQPFLLFLTLWVGVSVIFGKYSYSNKAVMADYVNPVIISNLFMLGTISIMIFGFQRFGFSRLIVFGTIGIATLAEFFIVTQYYYYRKLNREADKMDGVEKFVSQMGQLIQQVNKTETPENLTVPSVPVFSLANYQSQIISETSTSVYNFMLQHVDAAHNQTMVLNTSTRFNVEILPVNAFNTIINLQTINDIKYLNKFFEAVNHKLEAGGLFIDCVVTNEIKKARILHTMPPVLNRIYYFFYFLFRRAMPKLPYLKKIYFFLTNGYDRSLSKAESFGRLYSCGFEVLDHKMISGRLYFVAQKIKIPEYDSNPTYGPVIALRRVGKNGKIIHVYKLRTMHPFAEYLQAFVHESNDLDEGGKFKDDFRISTAGRIFRKFWLDELPMVVNLFTGELKLVGVRPISKHYFSLYPPELQEKRIKYKPGLVPPFYADLPKTIDEIIASEMKYLESYEKHPMRTDWNYFWKAFRNIVFKRVRSQ
jgi:lipopolysaccharide/colanic/teichoic acid biosynthesis glycosyltransferase